MAETGTETETDTETETERERDTRRDEGSHGTTDDSVVLA